jgi:hypothetical protein
VSSRTRAGAFRATTVANGLVSALDMFGLVASRVVAFATVGAVAFSWGTSADTFGTSAAADGLFTARKLLRIMMLAGLEICQSSRFLVDICDLLFTLGVKITNFLTSGCAQSLLEVGVKATPSIPCLVSYSVLVVDSLGLVGSLELGIEVL